MQHAEGTLTGTPHATPSPCGPVDLTACLVVATGYSVQVMSRLFLGE